MKTPVVRIFVLGPARSAHLEIAHRRVRAVVRNVFYYRETRAAVCAVDKRIAISTVVFVDQLRNTILTGRNICGDRMNFGPDATLGRI